MKLLFLYTELSSYTLACFNQLINQNVELSVVFYPVNKEAPFRLEFNKRIDFIPRNKEKLEEIIFSQSFNLVLCSGWSDKKYLSICTRFKKNEIPVVLCMDNRWDISFKKILASIFGRFLINFFFDFAWVPGNSQFRYASKLGFKSDEIFRGLYSADTDFFNMSYLESLEKKKGKFPKCFIYVGRYYEFKGLYELWRAFEKFSLKFPEWELWCVGTGDIEPFNHPRVKHFGFLQPAELCSLIADAGVFVLPSRIEPWGVIVHEMAAAGFPMILSDQVGAAECFLKENENGFMFESNNIESCYDSLCKMAAQTDQKLNQMSLLSFNLSKKYSTKKWEKKLMEIYDKFKN